MLMRVWHEIFSFWVFHKSVSSHGPVYPIEAISNFYENSRLSSWSRKSRVRLPWRHPSIWLAPHTYACCLNHGESLVDNKNVPPLSIRNQLCETCASQQDQNQQRNQLGNYWKTRSWIDSLSFPLVHPRDSSRATSWLIFTLSGIPSYFTYTVSKIICVIYVG